jgi:hypothetical protein
MYLLSYVKREARLRPTQIWLRTAGSVHVALSRLISDQRMPSISPRLAPVNMSQLDAFAVFVPVPPERDQTQGAKAACDWPSPAASDWHGPAHRKRT